MSVPACGAVLSLWRGGQFSGKLISRPVHHFRRIFWWNFFRELTVAGKHLRATNSSITSVRQSCLAESSADSYLPHTVFPLYLYLASPTDLEVGLLAFSGVRTTRRIGLNGIPPTTTADIEATILEFRTRYVVRRFSISVIPL